MFFIQAIFFLDLIELLLQNKSNKFLYFPSLKCLSCLLRYLAVAQTRWTFHWLYDQESSACSKGWVEKKSWVWAGPSSDTGWSNWIEISFDLITLGSRHPMKWDRSPFSPNIQTLWYILSKNSNRSYIIFTILRIKQMSLLFCKISETKAWIFMKFCVVVNYYLLSWISWRSVH